VPSWWHRFCNTGREKEPEEKHSNSDRIAIIQENKFTLAANSNNFGANIISSLILSQVPKAAVELSR
jgi:hypothetical protein